MSEVPGTSDVAAGPPGTNKSATMKKGSSHPSYADMIQQSLTALKGKGASRQALLKQMMKTFNLGQDEKLVNTRLKLALNRELEKGMLVHSTGKGATGSVKLNKQATKATGSAKAAIAKKPKAAAAVKKPKAKVATTKKAVTPKKVSLGSSKAKKPVSLAKKPSLTKKPTAKAAKPKAATKKATVKPKVTKAKVTKAAVSKGKKPAGRK